LLDFLKLNRLGLENTRVLWGPKRMFRNLVLWRFCLFRHVLDLSVYRTVH